MVYSNKPIEYYKEKRKRPDPIVQLVNLCNGLVWIILIAILLITNRAMPPVETVFDRFLGVELRKHWDYQVLQTVQLIMAGLFAISSTGILLNTRRLKRTTDHIRVSLVTMAVFSFVGNVVLLFILR